jgi:glycosyltransferase involved in cell wall biosynthesis
MRVAYFTDSLPPVADGVTRTLSRLTETLETEGVDYRFFAAVRPDLSLPWRRRVHKVTAVPFPLYPYYRLGLPIAGGIDKPLRDFRPDLIHVVSPTPLGIFGLDRARRLGVPVVGSFHTDFCSYLPYYRLARWEPTAWRYLRWFYNRCHVSLAPSPSMAERLREHGVQRVGLWRRGVDTRRFSPALRSEALRAQAGAGEGPLLLYVGRLVREKNLDDLVAAMGVLRTTLGPRAFRLAIVGEGPYGDTLRTHLPEAYFAGYLQGAALAQWYASADLFVFPSTTETFGNVILEAFASGLPVVGADACGTRDLVAHGVNGLLARPNDGPDFAGKIAELLLDRARLTRMSEVAERTALRYQWPAVNRGLIENYRGVIDGVALAA